MTHDDHPARDAATFVLDRLQAKGFVAMLAGGCVRDMLLELPPKDFDVATNATPDQVGHLFPRANHVGAKFGVMLVRKYGHEIEIATFRSDGTYTDGRHPDTVTFGTDQQDARRRDFTINGMFFDTTTDTVIDYVGGRDDLQAKLIRTIGDARERLGEDFLRMLRAVRFAARLGFSIETKTAEAITTLAPQLAMISPERIWMELDAILSNPRRHEGWRLLTTLGLTPHLTSGWSAVAGGHALVQQRLEALGTDPIEPTLGMAALLCDETREVVETVCTDLRQSNRDVAHTNWLVRSLAAARHAQDLELADVKALMAHERWKDLVVLLRADLLARSEGLDSYEGLTSRADGIAPDAVAPPPLLDGHGLALLGCRPGPNFGHVLTEVYRAQRNERITTPTEAQALAKDLLRSEA